MVIHSTHPRQASICHRIKDWSEIMMSTTREESEVSCHLFEDNAAEQKRLKEICLTWGFWPYEEVARALGSGHYLLVYASKENQPWSGALLLNRGPYSTDVIYIFVSRSQRQRGVGKQLLGFLEHHLKSVDLQESVFLEVRASNTAAIRLYEGFGMELVGFRKKYYADGEDAKVYILYLNTQA